MAALSLRSSFAWTLAGNVVYALCLWAQLSVLTKLGDPSTVGRYALASAVATPAFTLAHLQLRALIAADAKGAREFRDYLGVRLALVGPTLALVTCIGIAAYDGGQALAICLFAVGRAIESVSDIYYGYQQRLERLDLVATSMVVKGLAALAAFGGVFAATGSLTWGLAANAVAWLVPLLAFDIPRTRALARSGACEPLRPRWHWPVARELMVTAAPMGLVMLAAQMRNTIPRTMLEAHFSERELGLFSALAYLAVAGATVVASVSQAGLARLGRYCAEGAASEARRLLRGMLGIGAAFGAAGILVAWAAGGLVLRLLYSAEYAGQGNLLVLVMVDAALVYAASLLGAPATAMRLYLPQLVIHGSAVAVLAAAGLLLIPRWGMHGAAWTMMAGSAWVVAGYAVIVRRGFAALSARAPGEAA